MSRDYRVRRDIRVGESDIPCADTVFCVPTVTVSVDEQLKRRMEKHPEINWSEVTRQAIEEKISELELLDELTADSTLSAEDAAEISERVDENVRAEFDRLREDK